MNNGLRDQASILQQAAAAQANAQYHGIGYAQQGVETCDEAKRVLEARATKLRTQIASMEAAKKELARIEAMLAADLEQEGK